MELSILCFGVTKDFCGEREISLNVSGSTVKDLKETLSQSYEGFNQLPSLAIAVNQKYASDDTILKEQDEIALIPPVSGG